MDHFEDLWCQAEELHQNIIDNEHHANIIDELIIKLNLYKTLEEKSAQLNEIERQEIKSRAMGEVLLTLTKLSLKDNVNVYSSLGAAVQYRSIGVYAEQFKS